MELSRDYPLCTDSDLLDSAAINGTSVESAALPLGQCYVIADVDMHWTREATGSSATTSDELLPAGVKMHFRVNSDALIYIQMITGGITGRYWIRREM